MSSEHDAARIVELLSDHGFSVVGPVDRAATALALAAQSPVTLAVVAERLGGRRDGRELASELMRTWGAPAIVLDADAADPAEDLSSRARAILAGEHDPPPAAA